MAGGIAINVRKRFVAILALAIIFSTEGGVVSYATDNNGLPLTVQVVTPTAVPSPRTEVPVEIPVDVSVAEAVFPIVLTGLAPNSYVEIFANSTPVLIASGFADSTGRFETSVHLPPNLPVGDHTISATNTLANGTKISTTIVAFAVSSSGTIAPSSAAVASAAAARALSAPSPAVGGVVTEQTLAGSAETVVLGPDPFNLGGVLYFGGLVSHAAYPDGAFAPAAEMSFAVRNVSKNKITADVAFSVTNAFGMTVGHAPLFVMHDLLPGETRRLSSVVNDIGQWGAFTAHMKLTPPEIVGGNTLTTFERSDDFVAFIGWVLLAVLFAGGLVVTYLLGRRYWAWATPRELVRQVRDRLPFVRNEQGDDVQDSMSESSRDSQKRLEIPGAGR